MLCYLQTDTLEDEMQSQLAERVFWSEPPPFCCCFPGWFQQRHASTTARHDTSLPTSPVLRSSSVGKLDVCTPSFWGFRHTAWYPANWHFWKKTWEYGRRHWWLKVELLSCLLIKIWNSAISVFSLLRCVISVNKNNCQTAPGWPLPCNSGWGI